MNLASYLVLGGVLASLIAAVLWIIHRKKQGGNDCGACSYSGNCADKDCR